MNISRLNRENQHKLNLGFRAVAAHLVLSLGFELLSSLKLPGILAGDTDDAAFIGRRSARWIALPLPMQCSNTAWLVGAAVATDC